MGQSEKPQTIIVPTGSLGEISEVRKKMLEMTLISNLDDHFAIVPKDLFEEAEEKAFEELDYEECTEEQCIMMIKEILQVENSFQLVLMSEEGDTQISVIWNDLDQKRVEEEYCEGCKTKELRKSISELVIKLMSENKDIAIGDETPNRIESKPKNLIENKSESVTEKPTSNEEWKEPYTGMIFVKIPKKTYWMGKYEVTQEQWMKVMGNNPSTFSYGGNYPVESISWNQVKSFTKKLNQLSPSKKNIRLPNWDEWKYTCKAGPYNLYGTADGTINRNLANYGLNIGPKDCCYEDESDGYKFVAPVGSYPANNFGIHDMSGNLREFTDAPKGMKLFQNGDFRSFESLLMCQINPLNHDHPDEQDPNDFHDWVGFRLLMDESLNVLDNKSQIEKFKHSSKVVLDTSTGLMWQKKTDGIERNWKDAKRYCESLELDGFKNWELPSKPVLSMMTAKQNIFDEFKRGGWFWTSTPNRKKNGSAAMIGMWSKLHGFSPIRDKYLVRCVRNKNE